MSSKIDKQELKSPDAFISTSDHVFAFIERHMKSIGAAVVICLIAGMGYIGYTYMESRAESRATESLYGPQAELKKAETKVRDDRAKTMADLVKSTKGKKDLKPEPAKPADYAVDYQPAVTKIKAQIQDHAKTKAALVAALNLSSFLMQQKQFAEASAVLDLPKSTPRSGDLLAGFWQMHRGIAYMENQKFAEAAQAYQAIIADPGLKAFHPEAMLKLGVAYEQKGEADKARQIYEKLGREFPDSEASSSAQQYLRLLDMKTQKG